MSRGLELRGRSPAAKARGPGRLWQRLAGSARRSPCVGASGGARTDSVRRVRRGRTAGLRRPSSSQCRYRSTRLAALIITESSGGSSDRRVWPREPAVATMRRGGGAVTTPKS
ncbi:unnamed protein product [Lampetra fluviatilis]